MVRHAGRILLILMLWGCLWCPAIAAQTSLPGEEDELAFLDEAEEDDAVPDPLYYWNKAMFHVNDRLYFWVLQPVASGYRAVTPDLAREGIRNFFTNLTTPIRFLNCLLQGKSDEAGVELGRFMVNTTIGVLGFGNPADRESNLRRPPEEDFGQTLAVYGVGEGCYIVWPILGPSTLRDSIGMAGDMTVAPLTYVDPAWVSTGAKSLDTINGLSFRLGDYETLRDAALDPYPAFRDAYLQYRRKESGR